MYNVVHRGWHAGPCVCFATLFTGDVPAACGNISPGLIAGQPTSPLLVFLQYYPRGGCAVAAPEIYFFPYSHEGFLFPLEGPLGPPLAEAKCHSFL